MFIQDYNGLKSYILRQLGSEQYRIEISDQNFTDIYNKNIKYMQEYTNDAVNEYFILYTLEDTETILGDNIINVLDIITDGDYNFGNLSYPGFSYIYDFLSGTEIQTSAWMVFKETMRDIRNLFRTRIPYTFNVESRKLIIHNDLIIDKEVLIRVQKTEDVTNLYSHELFLKLLEKDCYIQWLQNIDGKYDNTSFGNGLTINRNSIQTRIDKLTEEIEKLVDEDAYSFLSPFTIE